MKHYRTTILTESGKLQKYNHGSSQMNMQYTMRTYLTYTSGIYVQSQ